MSARNAALTMLARDMRRIAGELTRAGEPATAMRCYNLAQQVELLSDSLPKVTPAQGKCETSVR